MNQTHKSPARRFLIGVILFLMIAIPQTVAAQGFDLQQFNPMPNPTENFLGTSSADVAPHMGWSSFLLFNYANDPLIRRQADGDPVESLVEHQGTANLLLSIGLMDRLELGLDVPLIVLQQGGAIAGSGLSPEDGSVGIGDIRLVPKVQLFSTREGYGDDGFALALLLDTHLPTGNGEVLQGGDFRIGPRLAADAMISGTRVGLNVGYLYRAEQQLEDLEVRDTLSWGLGVEVPVIDKLSLTGEVFGRLTPMAAEFRRNESPTELLLGGKFKHDGLHIIAGGGAGLVNGYGTPDFRAFLGLGWATPRLAPEPEPEPMPEPEPEPECRTATVAEDCPDVPAASCEDDVLTTHAALCADGECDYSTTETPCPGSTICGEEDGEPACVAAPECDGDGDCTDVPQPTCEDDVLTTYAGICVDSTCEYQPTETSCEEEYECGLRSGIPACVERTDLVEVDEETERIEIREVIFFAVNSDEIESRSFRLLDQVAQVLENNPQLTLIRIEGHTDSTGNRNYNVALSLRRAESTRQYLIEKGIDPARLRAEGLGPDSPIEDNATEEGRATNRRVELHIEERE